MVTPEGATDHDQRGGVERLVAAIGKVAGGEVRLPNGSRFHVRAVEKDRALDRGTRSRAERVHTAGRATDGRLSEDDADGEKRDSRDSTS